MSDLATWLRAQLDEDERVAEAARFLTRGSWRHAGTRDVLTEAGRLLNADQAEQAEHIALHDPARVLAEVEAKRRILDEAVPLMDAADEKICEEWSAGDPVTYDASPLVLRLLALPYAARPGYLDEWRPEPA